MNIKVTKKRIEIEQFARDETLIQGEKNVERVTFELEKNYKDIELSSLDFFLRGDNEGVTPEVPLGKRVSTDKILLDWDIDETFTSRAGGLRIEIRGVNGAGGVIFKAISSALKVKKSIDYAGNVEIDLIEDAIQLIELTVADGITTVDGKIATAEGILTQTQTAKAQAETAKMQAEEAAAAATEVILGAKVGAEDLQNNKSYLISLQLSADGQPQIKYEEVI